MPVKAGRHQASSDKVPSLPGQRVETAVPQAWARVPGIAGRHFGPLDPGPSRLGQLVDPVGPKTRPGVAQDRLLTPGALGHGHKSTRSAGRHRRSSDPSASVPGQLVDTAGQLVDTAGLSRPGKLVDTAEPRERARFPWDSWATQRDIGHWPESPGTPGRPRDIEKNRIRPGELD